MLVGREGGLVVVVGVGDGVVGLVGVGEGFLFGVGVVVIVGLKWFLLIVKLKLRGVVRLMVLM